MASASPRWLPGHRCCRRCGAPVRRHGRPVRRPCACRNARRCWPHQGAGRTASRLRARRTRGGEGADSDALSLNRQSLRWLMRTAPLVRVGRRPPARAKRGTGTMQSSQRDQRHGRQRCASPMTGSPPLGARLKDGHEAPVGFAATYLRQPCHPSRSHGQRKVPAASRSRAIGAVQDGRAVKGRQVVSDPQFTDSRGCGPRLRPGR
jgi:hypothetical protein